MVDILFLDIIRSTRLSLVFGMYISASAEQT